MKVQEDKRNEQYSQVKEQVMLVFSNVSRSVMLAYDRTV